jgi:hypothetical protein
LKEPLGEFGYPVTSAPLLYGVQEKAKTWRTEKKAISMQINSAGIPMMMSGYASFDEVLTTWNVDEVRILIRKDCQKDRKMTALIAATFKNGR